MHLASIVMLLAGLALAAWNTWQHLGRTSAARAWAGAVQGELKVRSVLVVRPMIAVVLVLGGLVDPLSSSSGTGTSGTGTSGAMVVLALCVLAALVVGLAWMVLPLPVPRWAQPRWFRETARRRGGRQRARG